VKNDAPQPTNLLSAPTTAICWRPPLMLKDAAARAPRPAWPARVASRVGAMGASRCPTGGRGVPGGSGQHGLTTFIVTSKT